MINSMFVIDLVVDLVVNLVNDLHIVFGRMFYVYKVKCNC